MEIYGHNDYRDYLIHYGVPGMKWKTHKYSQILNGEYIYNDGSSSTLLMTGKSKASKKARKTINRLREKAISKVSDDEEDIKIEENVDAKELKNKKSKKKNDDIPVLEEAKSDKKSKSDKENDKKLEKIANEVIQGKHGAGDERKSILEKKGLSYAVVQNKVNELLGVSKRHKVTKSDEDKMSTFYGTKTDSSKKKSSSKSNTKKSKPKSTKKKNKTPKGPGLYFSRAW